MTPGWGPGSKRQWWPPPPGLSLSCFSLVMWPWASDTTCCSVMHWLSHSAGGYCEAEMSSQQQKWISAQHVLSTTCLLWWPWGSNDPGREERGLRSDLEMVHSTSGVRSTGKKIRAEASQGNWIRQGAGQGGVCTCHRSPPALAKTWLAEHIQD